MTKFLTILALFGLVALGMAAESAKKDDLQTESSAFYGYSPYGLGYGYGSGLGYGLYGGYAGYGGYGGYGYPGYAGVGLGYGGYPGVGYGLYY